LSTITEKRALGILKEELLSTYSIDPHIPEDDKEAIWDGYVSVYTKSLKENRKFKKEEFLGKINVQVKGRTVKSFNKNISVKKIDLEKFALEPGTIYYVIQLNEKKYNIYYYEFYNVDVKRILKNMEHNSITLPFEKFPTKPNDIYNLHKLFLKNQSLQVVQNNKMLTLKDVFEKNSNPTFTFDLLLPSNFTKEDVYNSVITQRPFICYQDGDIKIPIERLSNNVCVVSFFNKTRTFHFENDEITHVMDIYFENDIFKHIIIDNKVKIFNEPDGLSATIKYNRSKSLDETLNVLNVVESFMENKRFKFYDSDEYINGLNSNNNTLCVEPLKTIKIEKEYLLKLKKLLKLVNINKQIDISLLKEKDYSIIGYLYDAIVLSREVPFGVKDNNVGIIEIANISILIRSVNIGNGKFRLYNYFAKDDYIFYFGDVSNQVSKYIFLITEYPKYNGFKLCNNINLNQLLIEILNNDDNEQYLNYLNSMELALIDYFDLTKEIVYLNAAYKIACYLLEKNDTNKNYLINKYQIEYRLNQPSSNFKSKLLEIKNTSDYDIYRCGAAILLDAIDDFEYYFERLSEIEQENFRKYPIYYLYSKNKAVKGEN